MKTLIIVDVQNDFCPGGSLEVTDGEKIIPVINQLTTSGLFDQVIASQDWHPLGHISFASRHNLKPFTSVTKPDFSENVIVWPDHCVVGTHGAELHSTLNQLYINAIVRKGMNINEDSYSAYEAMKDMLFVRDIYVTGIATDVCVLATVMNMINAWKNFQETTPRNVHIILDACAGVNDTNSKEALLSMYRAGAIPVVSDVLLNKEYLK